MAARRRRNPGGVDWQARHDAARLKPKSINEAAPYGILAMIKQLAAYHHAEYGRQIGDDSFAGPEIVIPMLQAARAMLNTDIGRLDAGATDNDILELAQRIGLKESEWT